MFVLGRRCYDEDEDKHHRRGNLLNDAIVALASRKFLWAKHERVGK